MSTRPLIAVVAYTLAPGRVTRWPEGGYGVPAPYLDALRRAGARAAILAPGEPASPEDILEPFDGLLLVGGGDVEPARYGGTPHPHLYGVDPERDELETGLLRAADRMALSTLCICRGFQIMNVAFGGSLYAHLPDLQGSVEHGAPAADTRTLHEVRAAEGSWLRALTGDDALSCSSHHHQGVDRLGDGLVATGWSDDGLVETLERTPGDAAAGILMLGVQWHPEDTADVDPAQQSLFDGLVTSARATGRPRAHEHEETDLTGPAPTGARRP